MFAYNAGWFVYILSVCNEFNIKIYFKIIRYTRITLNFCLKRNDILNFIVTFLIRLGSVWAPGAVVFCSNRPDPFSWQDVVRGD